VWQKHVAAIEAGSRKSRKHAVLSPWQRSVKANSSRPASPPACRPEVRAPAYASPPAQPSPPSVALPTFHAPPLF